jgi:NAD+ kinase
MSRQRVGVVGDETLAAAVEAAGGDPQVTTPEQVESVAFVVAAGEAAVVDLARSGVDVPVLPIEAGEGVRSVSRPAADETLERLVGSDSPTERHPVLSVSGPGTDTRAVFDVTLAAAEPARISEFAVRSGGESVARFRADGVVTSTPAGSVGYNRSAGGPVVAPETDVVSVVPLAPFATDADHWVLPAEEVTLSVTRDETPVELLADGRSEGLVETGEPIDLAYAGAIETFVVPESARFF